MQRGRAKRRTCHDSISTSSLQASIPATFLYIDCARSGWGGVPFVRAAKPAGWGEWGWAEMNLNNCPGNSIRSFFPSTNCVWGLQF